MARKPLPVGTWGKISRREVEPKRWRATARFRDFDGRTRQVEAWGKSGAAAEASLREALIDRAAPAGDDVGPDMRLDQLGLLWLAELAAGNRVAPQSIDEYRRVFDKTVIPAVGGLRIREATTGRIDRLLKALASSHPSKARQTRVVLAGMLGMAVRHDAITTNPVHSVSPLPSSKLEPRALTIDELRALREGIRTWQTDPTQRGPKRAPDLLDVVDVLLGTGARIGEVLAIRWRDVDLGAVPSVRITGTIVQVKGQGIRRQENPKTSSGVREVTLPRFAADTLLRMQVEAMGNAHDVVFPSSTGTLRSPHNFRRQWRSARAAAGFDWVTPHTYRRTVATLLDRERNTKDAAAQLGHSGTAVTERHYVEKMHKAPDMSQVLQVLGEVKIVPGDSQSVG